MISHAECVSTSPGADLYPPEPGPPMMNDDASSRVLSSQIIMVSDSVFVASEMAGGVQTIVNTVCGRRFRKCTRVAPFANCPVKPLEYFVLESCESTTCIRKWLRMREVE